MALSQYGREGWILSKRRVDSDHQQQTAVICIVFVQNVVILVVMSMAELEVTNS